MTPPRVGIVGARRVRSGLGPFVARELRRAGAAVVAVAGTRAESAAEAVRELRALGIEARGHVGVAGLLGSERLDALVILSPHAAHLEALEAALGAGLHVLCEKPLVHGVPEPARRARALVDCFHEAGLVLHENCPWPFALPAFESLHPGALAAPPRAFAMRMSPGARGAAMLVDALSHPLSVLQALSGSASGRVSEISFPVRSADGLRAEVAFTFATEMARVDARVELVGEAAPPREVWLALDGRRARRIVNPDDWSFAFEDAGRRVALPDPMAPLVRDFVAAVGAAMTGARPPRAEAVAARMAALQTLLEAFEATDPVVASGPSRREEALRPASGRSRAEKESR